MIYISLMTIFKTQYINYGNNITHSTPKACWFGNLYLYHSENAASCIQQLFKLTDHHTNLISCNKKEIKIPTLDAKGIQEIHNHSQVWFFFEIKNNDTIAKLNKKNTISTTHWIYNIDKKLALKSIIPSIDDVFSINRFCF